MAVSTGSSMRTFNVGCLEIDGRGPRRVYPQAKFIVTVPLSEVLKLLGAFQPTSKAQTSSYLIRAMCMRGGSPCEHLKCSPPSCSFPQLEDLGQRHTLEVGLQVCVAASAHHLSGIGPHGSLSLDHRGWLGVHVAATVHENEGKWIDFDDRLEHSDLRCAGLQGLILSPEIWRCFVR